MMANQYRRIVFSYGDLLMTTELGSGWSEDELEAAVDVYLRMLAHEHAEQPYNKAQENADLRAGPLHRRTKSAVEYRMQNISAALHELCLPYIAGYKPAKNIGTQIKDKIREVLARKGAYQPDNYAPAFDDAELDLKVLKLSTVLLSGAPRGIDSPKLLNAQKQTYARDPLVKRWVLLAAGGCCEGCGQPAPFTSVNGPFLEVHHVRHLAEQGSDKHTNAVALCPNCHRRCHFSTDRLAFTAQLYGQVERLVAE